MFIESNFRLDLLRSEARNSGGVRHSIPFRASDGAVIKGTNAINMSPLWGEDALTPVTD